MSCTLGPTARVAAAASPSQEALDDANCEGWPSTSREPVDPEPKNEKLFLVRPRVLYSDIEVRMDLVEDSTMKWWKGKGPVLLGTALIVGGIAMALVAYASPTPRMHVLPSRLVATDAEPLVVTLRITNPALAPLSVENSGCGCNMTLGFERELRLAPLSSAEFSVTIDVSSPLEGGPL